MTLDNPFPVYGTVRDKDGNGLANQVVRLWDDTTFVAYGYSTTDADGYYIHNVWQIVDSDGDTVALDCTYNAQVESTSFVLDVADGSKNINLSFPKILYINNFEMLAHSKFTTRVTKESWGVQQNCAESYPFVGQTNQQPSQINLDFKFAGDNRFDAVTSLKSEIDNYGKILINTNDYIYGTKTAVWIAQSKLQVKESDGKTLTVLLQGVIDQDQIHSCDFSKDWSGTLISTESLPVRRYCIRDDVISPTASSTYDAAYTPSYSIDVSDKLLINFWIFSDRASTAYSSSRLILQTSAGNYYYWDSTYSANTWTFIEHDITSPDGTIGSPSLDNINTVEIQIITADTVGFYHRIDNIRAH